MARPRQPLCGCRRRPTCRNRPHVPASSRSPLVVSEVAEMAPSRRMQPTGAKGLMQGEAWTFAQELPGARVRYNSGFHVTGNEAQNLRHSQAKGFLRAEGEYRHLHFAACCKECLVVDGVLTKGTKLFERIVHGMRSRIELGVMLTRCPVDLFWIGR